MGNALLKWKRRRGSIRVMRMDGHMLKIRAPATAGDVLTEHPGHVLLHSEALRHLGVRAVPLHASAELAPRNLYVLVEAQLLRPPSRARPRGLRTASDVSVSSLARLDALLLQRRSLSDVAGPARGAVVEEEEEAPPETDAPLRVKLRLSQDELAQLMARATATSASDDDHVASTLWSGSLAPPKTALPRIPESSYRFSGSQNNRVRFKQQTEINEIEQEH